MRTFKSVFGIVGAVMPILYCAGFLIYFTGVERFTGVPVGNALGPTILGLGAVAILLSIPLVVRILRLVARAPSPAPAAAARGADQAPAEPANFDPDAAIARYLAQRPAAAPAPPAPPARPGFGRKGT